jgi:hypothetical protein
VKIRHTAPELVRSLGRHGLRFRSFTLESEGAWSGEDADWNYKDVPHLNEVHTLARAIPAAIGDEIATSVNMQKIAGIGMPIALANYVASDGSQVYYTTMLCFVLVVETRISDVGDVAEGGGASVQTTYHVGGPRVAMWAFPLLRRILTANYHVLMSEDIPMREQRGLLRRAGFSFASDGRPRTFAETVDLTVRNVVAPVPDCEKVVTIDLSALREGATITAGSGPDGLRIVRTSRAEISIFNRVCDHEGAPLDCALLSGGVLVCPWHAKRVKPLAIVKLDAADRQSMEVGPGYEVVIEDSRMTIAGVA